MLKNMGFGIRQSRFKPSLSDSQTEALFMIRGTENCAQTAPPIADIPFVYILLSVVLSFQSSCVIKFNALPSSNSNVLPVFRK